MPDMPYHQPPASPEAEDLHWLAFRYISEEMTQAELSRFEARLAEDQSAREAVVRAVQLEDHVKAAFENTTAQHRPELVHPVSRAVTENNERRIEPAHRRTTSGRASGTAKRISLLAVVAATMATGWLVISGDPSIDSRLAVRPAQPVPQQESHQPLSPQPSPETRPDTAGEVVRFWADTADNELSDAPVAPATLVSTVPESPDSDSRPGIPDWLMAAVLSDAGHSDHSDTETEDSSRNGASVLNN